MTTSTITHIYWTISNTHTLCMCFSFSLSIPIFLFFPASHLVRGDSFSGGFLQVFIAEAPESLVTPFIGLLKYSANFILALGRNAGQPGNPLDSRRSLLCRHCQQEPYFKLENSDWLPHSGEPDLCQLAQSTRDLMYHCCSLRFDPSGAIMWK